MNENLPLPQPSDLAGFPPGFFRWVVSEPGRKVWIEFERRACQMAERRKHYGAQSIIEVIRWNSNLRDGTEFKINNNWAPGLARLWMRKHGVRYPRFFRLRDSLGRDE